MYKGDNPPENKRENDTKTQLIANYPLPLKLKPIHILLAFPESPATTSPIVHPAT
jgi:hypothetical protein